MKIITVNLYQYNELSPAAQENMRETDPNWGSMAELNH